MNCLRNVCKQQDVRFSYHVCRKLDITTCGEIKSYDSYVSYDIHIHMKYGNLKSILCNWFIQIIYKPPSRPNACIYICIYIYLYMYICSPSAFIAKARKVECVKGLEGVWSRCIQNIWLIVLQCVAAFAVCCSLLLYMYAKWQQCGISVYRTSAKTPNSMKMYLHMPFSKVMTSSRWKTHQSQWRYDKKDKPMRTNQ